MADVLETDAERIALLEPFDRVTIGGVELPAIFDAPAADEVGVAATRPVVVLTDGQVAAHNVVRGTAITAITMRDGTTRPAHSVEVLRPDGGGYVRLTVKRTA